MINKIGILSIEQVYSFSSLPIGICYVGKGRRHITVATLQGPVNLMEVLDASVAWLSDYEVREHLREQKAMRDRISESIGRPVRPAENLLTIEFETLSYFQGHKHTEHFTSSSTLEELMNFLKSYALTKAEKLQLVNLLPQSEVEFYLVRPNPSWTPLTPSFPSCHLFRL